MGFRLDPVTAFYVEFVPDSQPWKRLESPPFCPWAWGCPLCSRQSAMSDTINNHTVMFKQETSLVLSVTTSNHDELITHLVQPFQIYLPNKFRPNRYQILNVSCQSLGHTWSHDTFAGTFFLGRTFDHFFELIIFVSGSSQHDFSCFTIQTPLIIMMKSSNAYDIVVVCYHC